MQQERIESMTPIELLAAIGNNKAALDVLPDNLRNAVLAAKKEKEESDRRMVEARKKAESEEQRKREKEELLRREREEKETMDCLCLGTWAENIPRNRRFALCVRDWKRFSDNIYNDELVNCIERCAVDVVRGYMNPYFGYFCGDGMEQHQLKSWWEQRLKPVIEAKTKNEFLTRIRNDWDFFKIYQEGETEFPFRILTYKVDEKGTITITGESKTKTWQEHRADLEREFAN